jgi:hypothetical protein
MRQWSLDRIERLHPEQTHDLRIKAMIRDLQRRCSVYGLVPASCFPPFSRSHRSISARQKHTGPSLAHHAAPPSAATRAWTGRAGSTNHSPISSATKPDASPPIGTPDPEGSPWISYTAVCVVVSPSPRLDPSRVPLIGVSATEPEILL